MRRASAPIPTNISEGSGRQGETELARFMQIRLGSARAIAYSTLPVETRQLKGENLLKQVNIIAQMVFGLSSVLSKVRFERTSSSSCAISIRSDRAIKNMRLLWGSASELGYLLLLAYDLDLLNQKEYRQLNIQTLEAKKMLASFIKNQEANQHFS